MSIQLQIYNTADQAAERTLVATLDGSHTQEAINAWSSELVAKHGELDEGLAFGIIASDHAWYINAKPKDNIGPNNGPNNNPTAPQKSPARFGKVKVANEDVLAQSRKVFEQQRLDKLKKEQALREFLASQK